MTTGHDLAMALRAAYLALHRRTDAVLARHGVTADQFVLLAALAEGDAVTQRDLARRASSDPNTVRAMLLLLEARGFVARHRHQDDARARVVALTAKGRRAYQKLWAAGEPVRDLLVAEFGADEGRLLLGLLGRVARVLGTQARADRKPRESGKVNGTSGHSGTAAGRDARSRPRPKSTSRRGEQ